MTRARAVVLATLGALPLFGCAAAAVPVIAGAAIATTDRNQTKAQPPPIVSMAPMTDALPTPETTVAQEFAALVDHVQQRAQLWREGAPIYSLVLDDRQTVLNPVAVGCERRAPVVIIDLDTAGTGPAKLPDMAITVTPGWIAALDALRRSEVTIVWVTDYPARDRDAVTQLLAKTWLDPAGTDRLMTLRSGTDRKQILRREIAQSSCVLAVVGDSRGDADEAYDYLRSPDVRLPIDTNWGEGWFLLPPPLSFSPLAQSEGTNP